MNHYGWFAFIPNYLFFNKIHRTKRMIEFRCSILKSACTHLFQKSERSPMNCKLREEEEEDLCSGLTKMK
jgi:hypothetical protein